MAALCLPPLRSGAPEPPTYPPINFFYLHFHNSIRTELDLLSQSVLLLEPSAEQDLSKLLTHLKQRYQFLEQVYKYHSSVEDEVVYPALEGKVRNVTNAYIVEHQDEEHLFEQLSQLLSAALSQDAHVREATIRRLVCKVEEIHTTLRKHLAKEEEQLQPLIVRHFSAAEQAELVAQFLYTIPLATVEGVLAWLKPTIPREEQEHLLTHIRHVISDDLLLQLLVTWLEPLSPTSSTSTTSSAPPSPNSAPLPCFCPPAHPSPAGRAPPPAPSTRPPLQAIVQIHHSIISALETLALEARGLQRARELTPPLLAILCERHRFLRSVCMFHTLSEEQVMFPEVVRIALGGGGGKGGVAGRACVKCKEEHEQEVGMFEELGRLLAEVKAYARRGRKEVAQMLEQLSCTAEQVVAAVRAHMDREEAEVLPVLAANLCTSKQRGLLWRCLQAMPLRLLERVMPWLMDKLSEEEASEMLQDMELGAPPVDAALVQLLSRWAQRGRPPPAAAGIAAPPPSPQSSNVSSPTTGHQQLDACMSDRDKDQASSAAAAAPPMPLPGPEGSMTWARNDTLRLRVVRVGPAPHRGRADIGARQPCEPPSKRPRTCSSEDECSSASEPDTTATAPLPPPAASATAPGPAPPQSPPAALQGYTPIDHIFQFHRALRTELQQLEADAMGLEAAALALPTPHPQPPSHSGRAPHPPLPSKPHHPLTHASVPTPTLSLPTAPPTHASPAASINLLPSQASNPSPAPAPIHPPPHTPPPQPCHPPPQPAAPLALLPLPPPGRGVQVGGAFTAEMAGAIQQLDGRFQFLWGIYRAHSRAEDEIVFPALERKEALSNVSHAYTLDHVAEEQLFHDVHAVLLRLKRSAGGAETQELALQLRRMCAAVRASLETHVRAEERELWPLFAEHFTAEEQQQLVGMIIGRTGAEVLQAMLPWVTGPFTEEEREAMMGSLRVATKNTKFNHWLDAVQPACGHADHAADAPDAAGAAPRARRAVSTSSDDLHGPLEEVAQYLRSAQEASGTVAESTAFRPGWEDLFRMNQKQLEASVRRVSNDPNLEPERKAYLLQHLMVSRYIVAQQKRMSRDLPPAAPPPAPGAAAPPPRSAQQVEALQTYANAEQRVLGCAHYQRKCKLVAPCCGRAFTCRLCHDDATGHRMDRYAVTEIVCMVCGLRQPAAGTCSGCNTQLAAYFCGICNLFDDEPGRDIYHCPFCNVCRRGRGLGVDFFHCMECNACMSLALAGVHKCREKCMEGNCPVCNEYLFDSSEPIKELPCGHFLHSSCFAAYTRHSYTCPVCSKSIGDMSVYFQMLDFLLSQETLPPEYRARTQPVLCHDCGLQGSAAFHFVYHKCPHCASYNTRVL